MIRKLCGCAAVSAGLVVPVGGTADNLTTTLTNTYGTPGALIEMPTAEMAPSGQLSANVSHFDGFTRTTLSFQITKRLSGSFRYTATSNFSPAFSTYYDRSFDLSFRVLDEKRWRPAVVVGVQDFVGTGVLSGEYIVATKSIGERLRVTGGIGWGRLGSYASDGGFGSRTPFSFAGVGSGGDFNVDDWFRAITPSSAGPVTG